MTAPAAAAQAPAQPPARMLRPVGALDLPRVERAQIGPRPEQLWVRVADLCVDPSYQRCLSATSVRLIRRMVEGWDWRLVQAVTVAELPGGRWELIDGQHRAIAALTHGGIPMLPATVLPVSGRDEAAAAFVAMNSARVAIRDYVRLKAEIAAEEPTALAIARCCTAAGVTLMFSAPAVSGVYPPHGCIATTTLRRVLDRGGETELTEILRICVEAGLTPVASAQIRAVETLRAEPIYRDHTREALVEVLSDWETIADTARDRARLTRVSTAQAMAQELYRRCTEDLL